MCDRALLALLVVNCVFFITVCILALYIIDLIMRGEKPNVKDIILTGFGEQPENVALRCGESMPESDDEVDIVDESLEHQEVEQEQVQRVYTPSSSSDSEFDKDLYSVQTECPFCGFVIVFVCKANHPGIRRLQEGLVSEELQPICYHCVSRYGLAHA
ncbi:E7 protein [Eumops bonariensis papillomavirus type 1]|nr:E7 protein [Eumops bonariensis papillomavirus type 1]